MVATLNVFDTIERLSQSLPLDPAKVAEILNTPLTPEPADDSPVMTSYSKSADATDSSFDEVDLRIPDPLFGSGGGQLEATLKSDEGVDSDAIFQQYGLVFQQDVPSPRHPPGRPAYYNYELPWGVLSLGVTNDDADKLVSFVMKPKAPE